ncbi:MAG: hypothetical protein ACP5JU_02525 [Minisyncoccia bacterium]
MSPILRYLLTRTLLILFIFIIILFGSYILFDKNIKKISNNLEERLNLLKEKESSITQIAETTKLKEEISKIESAYGIKIADLKNSLLNRKKMDKGELVNNLKNFLSNNNIKLTGEEMKMELIDSFSLTIESRLEDIYSIEKFIKDNNLNLKIVNINIQPLDKEKNIIKIDFKIF